MRLIALFLLFSLIAAVAAQDAPRAVGKDLMVKALPDFAGREGVVRANVYPPGASSPPHRHDAHVFLHLLEGELIGKVKGPQGVPLHAGNPYYKPPDNTHVISPTP